MDFGQIVKDLLVGKSIIEDPHPNWSVGIYVHLFEVGRWRLVVKRLYRGWRNGHIDFGEEEISILTPE
jgi:hypothetical protein